MPYSTLIITAGISTLASRNLIGAHMRQQDSPIQFPLGQQNPVAKNEESDENTLIKNSVAYFHAPSDTPDPFTVSAEYSVLYQLQKNGQLSNGALVHLIHTPTLGGRLSVQLQKPLLEKFLGVQVHIHELDVPFDPSITGGLALASGAFMGTISRLLRGIDPHSTAFAPIGGYKVMVALGHTAASFHGFHSLYLHEDSQVLQQIAPAPITLDSDKRALIARIALRVGNGAEWLALGAEEKKIIEQHPAFFARIDDLVELNELGQFLKLDARAILLEPEAEKERRTNGVMIGKQIRQIATLASSDPDHPGINHDLVRAPGKSHPWRLAQMGEGIRIAWQITPSEILIGKIWRDHDTYDREAAKWIMTPLPLAQKIADYMPLL
jgi:hypothetical protein